MCAFFLFFFAADEGASRPSSPLSPLHQPLNAAPVARLLLVEVLPSSPGLYQRWSRTSRSPPRRHLALIDAYFRFFLKRFSRNIWISEFSALGLSPKGSSSSGIPRKWIDFLNKETTKDKRNKPNRCNPGHRSFTEAYSGHGCSYSRKRMCFLSL